jgi:hypothetical protein
MPDYVQAPHVTATIDISCGKEEADFGPGESGAVKRTAAHWLREVCDVVGPRVRIKVEIALSSLDVPWTHRTQSDWKGDAAHGREYSADWIETTPEWGRGR